MSDLDFANVVNQLIEKYVASHSQADRDTQLAANYRLLPVSFQPSGAFTASRYGLSPAGEMFYWTWYYEPDAPPKAISEKHLRHAAMWHATDEYPELALFRPTRTNESVTCYQCHGSGHSGITGELDYGELPCVCGGSGWLP